MNIIKIIIFILALPFLVTLVFVLMAIAFMFFANFLGGNLDDITNNAVKNNDPSICSRFNGFRINGDVGTDSIQLKNTCYNSVAVTNKNPDACNYIDVNVHPSELKMRKDCYIKSGAVLTSKQISKYCSNIIEPLWRGECYGFLAGKANDISTCDLPSNQKIKVECYINFIRNVETPTISTSACAKLSGDGKDDCIAAVAWRAANLSICNLIINPDIKKYCTENVARQIYYIKTSK